jgi:hypothetical protein
MTFLIGVNSINCQVEPNLHLENFHFTSKYFGTNNRLLNVAVPSTQYNFPPFPIQPYFQ